MPQEYVKGIFQEYVMQSYPPRVLDRRLQEAWARATKEGPRVLMNLRVDLMEACLRSFYGGKIFEFQ